MRHFNRMFVQHFYHPFIDRLHYYRITVEVCFRIHIPDDLVYECTEEVTFSKLYDTFRAGCYRNVLFV